MLSVRVCFEGVFEYSECIYLLVVPSCFVMTQGNAVLLPLYPEVGHVIDDENPNVRK